jgi:hypothetical protein
MIDKALARRLWPERIIQPHPVSEVNPFESTSWLLRRTPSVIEDDALGSSDLGIVEKFDLYVSQILDSKSSRKELGQPWSADREVLRINELPELIGGVSEVDCSVLANV